MASEFRTQTSSAEASPPLRPADAKDGQGESESGYGSAATSVAALPRVTLTRDHLDHLNAQLERMHPTDVLRFARVMFPRLYQSTAFGLTGLVTLDMLSRIQAEDPAGPRVDLIFLDTLYHFPETYDLVDRVRARYPGVALHVFRPEGAATAAEFEARRGERLYETAAELYDWLAKVEPLQRAYAELGVAAVLTGRRRSQGGQRDRIPVLELDEERGVVKVNPLVTWSFQQVRDYVRDHGVPYNALLDRGYKSVGDWHSTSPVAEGEDERAGRWKGQAKTECGIHNKKSRYAQFLADKEARAKEQKIAMAFEASAQKHGGEPLQAQAA